CDRHAAKSATVGMLKQVVGELFKHHKAKNTKDKERNARLDQLEKRIAELDSKSSGLKWYGTWTEGRGRSFPEGAILTHHGGLWCAIRPTSHQPGVGADSGGRLVVKAG